MPTSLGVGRSPPEAIAAASRAIWIGVTETAPWPTETEAVSLAYQRSPIARRFHSRVGTRPLDSFLRSTPVGVPRPKARA